MKNSSRILALIALLFGLNADSVGQASVSSVSTVASLSVGPGIPKPQDLVNLSGTVNAAGQPGLVFTVPTGRWFVLTDIQAAAFLVGSEAGLTECNALPIGSLEIKEGITGEVKWSKMLATLAPDNYRPKVGIPFASGSQVMLHITTTQLATNPANAPVTWQLSGYLSGASAEMPWPPRPENIVSVSGSIAGESGGTTTAYQVPAGKWLVVTDFSVARKLTYDNVNWYENSKVDFAELVQTQGTVSTIRRPGQLAKVSTMLNSTDFFLPSASHYSPSSGMAFAPGSIVTLNVGPAASSCISPPAVIGMNTDWHIAGYLVRP